MNRSSSFKLILVLIAVFQTLFIAASSNTESKSTVYLTLLNDGRYDASSDLHVRFQIESQTRFQKIEVNSSQANNSVRTSQLKDGKVDVDIIIRGGELTPLLLPYSVKPSVRVEIADVHFITVDNISGVYQGNVEPHLNNEINFTKLHVFTGDETATETETNSLQAKLDYSIPLVQTQIAQQNRVNTTSDLLVYPNPVLDGNLFLQIPESMQNNVSISISNVLGSMVKRVQTESNFSNPVHVDLSGLNPGIYFVRVQSGQTEIVKKFNINR
jgi:hypothetical protein